MREGFRPPDVPELPRFFGGLVGYIGYGAARFFEELPKMGEDPTGLPDMHFFAPRKVLLSPCERTYEPCCGTETTLATGP